MNIIQFWQKITIKQLFIVNIVSLIISLVVFVVLVLPKDQQPNFISKKPLPTIAPTPTPTPVPTPTPLPTYIKINGAAKIEAKVISVSFDPDTNEMEVPHDVKEVGWYRYSKAPGDPGSTVMTAHYDTNTGAPAIFYNLKKVVPGDTFEITNDRSQKLTYEVKQIRNLPLYGWPEDKIYGERDYSQVTLITCAGVWDPVKKIYSNRLAVIGKLIDQTTADSPQDNKTQASSEQYLSYPLKAPQTHLASPEQMVYLKLYKQDSLLKVFLASNSNQITATDIVLNLNPQDIQDLQVMDLFESYNVEKNNDNLKISLFTDPKRKAKNSLNTENKEMELFNIKLSSDSKIQNISIDQANSQVLKNEPNLDPHLHPNILQTTFSD